MARTPLPISDEELAAELIAATRVAKRVSFQNWINPTDIVFISAADHDDEVEADDYSGRGLTREEIEAGGEE